MLILNITSTDPAGSVMNLVKAVNRYTKHKARLITTHRILKFDFDYDIWQVKDDLNEVEYLLNNADVFHLHKIDEDYILYDRFLVKDFTKGKPIFYHHHGNKIFRDNPEHFRWKYKMKNAKVFVSTPDLLRLIPEAKYLPNCVPINDVRYLPRGRVKKEKVVVGHCPTNRELKNTELFIDTIVKLKEKYDIEGVVIEDKTLKETLELKRLCHIGFDHLGGYYGLSALEFLSMGIPTVSGLDELNKTQIREFFGCSEIPFVIANKDNLYKTIETLIKDAGMREEIGIKSRKFMERYWTEKYIANKYIEEVKKEC